MPNSTDTQNFFRSDTLPLCVDLDETLCPVDTLWQHLGQVFFSHPFQAIQACLKYPIHRSRSRFKDSLVEISALDPTGIPVRPELVKYIKNARASGRLACLVTAANEDVARVMAAAHPIFDHVWASGKNLNLKSANKADFLCEKFGEQGYEYVGDCSADIKVWSRAGSAVVVAPGGKVDARLLRAIPDLKRLRVSPRVPFLALRLIFQRLLNR
ncbi:MAG: hypothetical protein ACK5NG_05515 [Chthoniobacterales bacterium]